MKRLPVHFLFLQVSVNPQSSTCLILDTHRTSLLPVSSCCHIRSTCHPRVFRVRVTNRSRSLLRSSFFFQNARLVAGWDACFRQPCQKHPSTNIARRCSRKTKSGLPNSLGWRRQPMMRCCRRSFASASSVLRFPRARMRDIICERFTLEYMSAMMQFPAMPPALQEASSETNCSCEVRIESYIVLFK